MHRANNKKNDHLVLNPRGSGIKIYIMDIPRNSADRQKLIEYSKALPKVLETQLNA